MNGVDMSVVEVVKNEVDNPARTNGTVHLIFLGPGDTFGERALLSIFINRVVFSELLKESHDSSNTHTLEITKRFRSNKDIVRNIFMRGSAQRSEKDLKFAVEYLKSVKFFSRFSFEVRKQLCKVMRLISAVTNTVLFAEGQIGRHFYIIFTGCVDVSVRAKNRFEETKESVVSRLGEGEYFGELALSQADGVRRATVVCTEFCELLVLGRDEYEPLIKKYQNEYHAQYAQMLRKNPYFIGPEWDDNTIEGMCSVMTENLGLCRVSSYHPCPYSELTLARTAIVCRASAGKFNDIFIREYSILAESPMKILVLSRFDIFHLMSAEARASLQRSSNGYIRESIQSRALKSVAWEKYKKEFITSVMAENQHQPFGSVGGRSERGRISIHQSAMLGKSQSAPLLPLNEARTLVDPGSLMLERRRGVTKIGVSSPGHQANGSLGDTQQNAREFGNNSSLNDEAQAGDSPSSPEVSSPKCRSSSLPQDARDLLKVSRSASGSSLLQRRSSTTTVLALKLQQGGNRPKLPPVAQDDFTPTLKTPLLALAGSGSSKTLNRRANGPNAGDSNFAEKSTRALLPAVSPIKEITTEESSSAKEYRSELRRCGRIRTEKADGIANTSKNGPAGASTGAIWDPVHGVCQPFAVLGFMKEQTVRPASRGISLSLSSGKLSKSAKSAADQLRKAAAVVSATGHTEFTRFRVFGKFRDVDDALSLFRQICAVEKTAGLSDGRDCSRFAIYKEDEMTMSLENFPSVDAGDAEAAAQFSAADLPQATGQRFACVSVSLQAAGATCVEAIVVHVYQCFPTPQSAVRFARQVAATLLAPSALSIVPLFEWIPLAELERFDARSGDLEQELELAMRRGGRESTWKARKEAIKKGVHAHKLKSAST
ncbi:unnamed protein product [Phytophthora lilii]|uniref:Unnamed protein product n=1 Tax=Phytophthora lilii TaxID=2077276 RepID=A0A9W6WQ05_9STRA|nr:unnamed protein product [Phytophthora lilii]